MRREAAVEGGQVAGAAAVGEAATRAPRPTPHAPRETAPELGEQFDDPEQQHEAATLGMWVFLATEVMFFGGLFLGYTAYRYGYPEAFADGSRHLNLALGAVNTAILLTSSLTMTLAIQAAQEDRRRALLALLLLTMLLGVAFLGVKGVEYSREFEERLVPGLNFAGAGPAARQTELFFVLYFLMTGLHGLHLAIGIAVVGAVAALAWRGRFSSARYLPVELTGLYWHFVDVVWVFLFALLYLLRR